MLYTKCVCVCIHNEIFLEVYISFYHLNIFIWIQLTHEVTLVLCVQHDDSTSVCDMLYAHHNAATTCHQTPLLQYHRFYSLCCAFYSHGLLIHRKPAFLFPLHPFFFSIYQSPSFWKPCFQFVLYIYRPDSGFCLSLHSFGF